MPPPLLSQPGRDRRKDTQGTEREHPSSSQTTSSSARPQVSMLAPTGTPPRPIGVSRGSDTTGRPIPTIPTPLPRAEGNDLLTSMVTALSAAAAAITAAAAAERQVRGHCHRNRGCCNCRRIAAYQVTRQQPPGDSWSRGIPVTAGAEGAPWRTPSSPPTPTSRTCASDRVTTQ